MSDDVDWDCYINPPEDPSTEEEDYLLFDEAWLSWVEDNQEWLEYLENFNVTKASYT
jgi:hypothetical protein